MFATAVVFVFGPTHYRKLAESKGKRYVPVATQAKFVPGGFLFQAALGRAPGVYMQCLCEVTIERYLVFKKVGFLERHARQSTVSPFSS